MVSRIFEVLAKFGHWKSDEGWVCVCGRGTCSNFQFAVIFFSLNAYAGYFLWMKLEFFLHLFFS